MGYFKKWLLRLVEEHRMDEKDAKNYIQHVLSQEAKLDSASCSAPAPKLEPIPGYVEKMKEYYRRQEMERLKRFGWRKRRKNFNKGGEQHVSF